MRAVGKGGTLENLTLKRGYFMSKKILFGVLLSLVLALSALGQSQVTVRGLLVYDPNGIRCNCDVYSKLLPDPEYSQMCLGITFADFLSFQNKHVEIVGLIEAYAGCEKVLVENIVELEPGFVLGDGNGDEEISLADVICQIDYLFRGGEEPQPMWTGDVNLDDRVSVGDAVFLVNHLLRGGLAPGHFSWLPHQTPCKGYQRIYESDSTEQIMIEVVENDVIVTHQNAFYNCCFLIKADVTQNEYDIRLDETTSGDPCRCMCYFDVTTMICDLAPGTYNISYYNADGEYMGGGEAVVLSPGKLVGHTQSGCLEALFLGKGVGNNGTVYFEVNHDTLIMRHDSSVYHCAAIIAITLIQEGSVLNFVEEDTSSVPANCICPFDLTATVAGLQAGWYTAKVWNEDMTILFGQADIYISNGEMGWKIKKDSFHSSIKFAK